MSFLLSCLRKDCLPCNYPYHPLPKKNDDSIQQADTWIESQPITDDIKYMESCRACEKYGQQTIKNLKRISVDSSNEDKILNHLIKICQKNNIVKQYLVKHLDEINADKEIKISLRDKLIPY